MKYYKRVIKATGTAALSLALASLLVACSEDFATENTAAEATGFTGFVLEVNAPSLQALPLTRTLSEENESSLDGNFVVFAFDSDEDEATLQWMLCTGDTNEDTNLNDAKVEYEEESDKNFTDSPAMTWHPASQEDGTGGRLYIENVIDPDPLYLLVLANVSVDEAKGLELTTEAEAEADADGLITASTRAQVIGALSDFDFQVIESHQPVEDLDYIPMSGTVELENGIGLGGKGELHLRRSVAKVTLNFEWNNEYYNDRYFTEGGFSDLYGPDAQEGGLRCFVPEEVIVYNVNSHATVYGNGSEPNYSNEGGKTYLTTLSGIDENDIVSDGLSYSLSVDFYIPETENGHTSAPYEGDGTDLDNILEGYPRISVLVKGTLHYSDQSGEEADETWYLLDFIPNKAEGMDDELVCLLRSCHYTFDLVNVTKTGSPREEDALKLAMPDNYLLTSDQAKLIVVTDDDLLSITADYTSNVEKTGEDGETYYQPFYIAVSSTSIELAKSGEATAKVKVETNVAEEFGTENGWTIDDSDIPGDEAGNKAISFVYDTNAKTLWLSLDDPNLVAEGETYASYITAGNLRKKMQVTIVAADVSSEEEAEGEP